MPIYAYKCSSCGHKQDVLQKLSDPVITTCPSCGKPDYVKQVSAPSFQLKGNGWYVTDFRDAGKSSSSKTASSTSASSSKPSSSNQGSTSSK